MENLQVTEWIQHFIRQQVREGDLCIDATMGNGNDTLLLARLAGKSGHVLAFDIQEQALKNTEDRLAREGLEKSCTLFMESHEYMSRYAREGSVSCIVFNLGYLPGGSHGRATKAGTTVRAIKEGLKLLKKKGLLTLCIYSGGDSGFEEKETVLSFLKKLNPREFLVIQAEYINRPSHPPIPVFIIKI